jgi:hypothetical protein
MELGSDKPALGAFLHGFLLGLARFGEGDKLFSGLLDDVGGDAVEGLDNVVEGEGRVGLGCENALDAEVTDTRCELLALDCG